MFSLFRRFASYGGYPVPDRILDSYRFLLPRLEILAYQSPVIPFLSVPLYRTYIAVVALLMQENILVDESIGLGVRQSLDSLAIKKKIALETYSVSGHNSEAKKEWQSV